MATSRDRYQELGLTEPTAQLAERLVAYILQSTRDCYHLLLSTGATIVDGVNRRV